MIGVRDPPPSTGSPRQLQCSSTRRDRRPGFLRGIGAVGPTNTSTSPSVRTPSEPKPSLRQRLRNLASFSRPFARDERRAASQTSSHAAARSTPCKTSLELEGQLKLADHDDRRIIAPQRQSPLTGDWVLTIARAGRTAPKRRAAGPAPVVFQLGLVARLCPRHVLRASLTRSERPLKPVNGSLRPMTARRQAARPSPGAPSAMGACARECRAIPSAQLPRMRQRSDRGMSQGGWTAVRLGRYSGLLSSR
jgi:hypothetical protein